MINDKLLLESLHSFYRTEYNRDRLLMILSDKKKISLRSIDWFITNYSKKYNTYYIIYENTESKTPSFESGSNNYRSNMNVFHSYKSQLKAYSKKKFDPFCRRDRLSFKLDDEYSVETTIGQLNFFKWAISNLVLEYIELNKDDIENDMNNSLKEMKLNHIEKDGRKKRQELSLSATRGLSMNHVPIQISFD